MRIAIISVSENGLNLSKSLKLKLDNDSTIISTDIYYKNIKKNMYHLFSEYDAIIGIMASGILIRSISKLIESKTKDPAIINIDECGNNVISLLSGHIGRANQLTKKIANLIDANPVITTATDVNNKLGVDVLANDLYYKIINPKEIVYFNKAILNDEEIEFQLNNPDLLINYFTDVTLEMHLSIKMNTKIPKDEIHVFWNNHKLIMKERELVIGIGCKRGKTENDILIGINSALNDLNLDISRINKLASAEIKKDEDGLLNLSHNLSIPISFISTEKLRLFHSNYIQKSEFVKSKFGIYGVSEPSALISAGFDSKLIYKKTAFNGVTIAVAISK